MKRNIIIVAATIAALSLNSCGPKKGPAAGATATAPVEVELLARTSPVERMTIAQTEEFTSTLLPYKKSFITPQMSLRIDEIRVDVGDHVKEGQVVARLDRNQYNQSAVQLKNTKQTLERMRKVYEGGGVSKSQIDELETSVTVLEETVANLERSIELKAPFSGIITGRYNEVGDLFAMAGNADGGMGMFQIM